MGLGDDGNQGSGERAERTGPPVHRAALWALVLCGLWAWRSVWPFFDDSGAASHGVAPSAPRYRLQLGDAVRFLADVAPLEATARICPPVEVVPEGGAVWIEGLGPGCRLRAAPMAARLLRSLGLALPINALSEADLTLLDGVGPARAKALWAARPYVDAGDLMRARGIGPKRARALAPAVRFTAPTPLLTPPLPPLAASTHRKP
jgi:hypothetical protein